MNDIEKDAIRYRWLRDTNLMPFRDPLGDEGESGAIDMIFICDEGGPCGEMTAMAPEDFDAAIDKEMTKRLNQEEAIKVDSIEKRIAENINLFNDDPELSLATHFRIREEMQKFLSEMKVRKANAAQAHTQSA